MISSELKRPIKTATFHAPALSLILSYVLFWSSLSAASIPEVDTGLVQRPSARTAVLIVSRDAMMTLLLAILFVSGKNAWNKCMQLLPWWRPIFITSGLSLFPLLMYY
jgi:hypothetical protein